MNIILDYGRNMILALPRITSKKYFAQSIRNANSAISHGRSGGRRPSFVRSECVRAGADRVPHIADIDGWLKSRFRPDYRRPEHRQADDRRLEYLRAEERQSEDRQADDRRPEDRRPEKPRPDDRQPRHRSLWSRQPRCLFRPAPFEGSRRQSSIKTRASNKTRTASSVRTCSPQRLEDGRRNDSLAGWTIAARR